MKISHRISSLKRDVDQINNEDFTDISNIIETTSFSPQSNNYQVLGSDEITTHPLESNLSWRIPAILGLVWTTDADRLPDPEANPENEWMIASFDNSDSENVVPLSTNISRETIDN